MGLNAPETAYSVTKSMVWALASKASIQPASPIWVKVKSAKTADGDASKLLEVATVRGNGVIEIPLENEIPVGRYLLSLTFWNEGWAKDVEDCFTVIVR